MLACSSPDRLLHKPGARQKSDVLPQIVGSGKDQMPMAPVRGQVNGLVSRIGSARHNQSDHDRRAKKNLSQTDSPIPIQFHFDFAPRLTRSFVLKQFTLLVHFGTGTCARPRLK
jgi:hypothetical protein